MGTASETMDEGCFLAGFLWLLSYFTYIAQTHTPRDSSTPVGWAPLYQFTIRKMPHSHAHGPVPDRADSSVEVPSSQVTAQSPIHQYNSSIVDLTAFRDWERNVSCFKATWFMLCFSNSQRWFWKQVTERFLYPNIKPLHRRNLSNQAKRRMSKPRFNLKQSIPGEKRNPQERPTWQVEVPHLK